MSVESVRKTRLLRWLAAPVAMLLLGMGLFVYALVIQARAKAILRDVTALKVGASSSKDVEAVLARHKQALLQHECHDTTCSVVFEVHNTWLHRIGLEPEAAFRAAVNTNGGTVHSMWVSLYRDTRVFPTSPSAGMVEEYQTMPQDHQLMHEGKAYWFPTPVGKPYLRIVLTAQAMDVQRQHAYAFSFKCLTKPGAGCDLPCDYLPLAWHDWEAALQADGWGFGSYYPDRKRCE